MTRAAIVLAVLLHAAAARADLRVAFDNDILARLDPADDDGFTNDIDIRFWRQHGDYLLGGKLFDRWITEEPRVAGRRRDLVELVATGERSWGSVERSLTLDARLGPTFTGNLGGRWGQNAFHTTCHCGQTLDEGLQSRYQGANEAVGQTNSIVGQIYFDDQGMPLACSRWDVDLRTLTSDESRRDNYLRGNTLQTDTYPPGVGDTSDQIWL